MNEETANFAKELMKKYTTDCSIKKYLDNAIRAIDIIMKINTIISKNKEGDHYDNFDDMFNETEIIEPIVGIPYDLIDFDIESKIKKEIYNFLKNNNLATYRED